MPLRLGSASFVGSALTLNVKLTVHTPPTGRVKPGLIPYLPLAASMSVSVKVLTPPQPAPLPVAEAPSVTIPGSVKSVGAVGQSELATNEPQAGTSVML